ncbi:MAG: hypothetical protein ACJATV_001478 [Granulosicoccus sp.]|jgi:hypothetical protein
MKKILSLLLIALLVSPVFAAWLPHEVTHALHSNNVEHFLAGGSHQHSFHEHNHDDNSDVHLEDHHAIHIDVVSYFSDYLNADLQRVNSTTVDITSFDVYPLDFIAFSAGIEWHHDLNLPANKSRVPVDWRMSASSNTPLYLSTQRLRI